MHRGRKDRADILTEKNLRLKGDVGNGADSKALKFRKMCHRTCAFAGFMVHFLISEVLLTYLALAYSYVPAIRHSDFRKNGPGAGLKPGAAAQR